MAITEKQARALDSARTGKRRRVPLFDRPAFWGYVFISPWLLGFLIFTAGPMLTSLYLSFQLRPAHYLRALRTMRCSSRATPAASSKSLTNTALYVLSVLIG